MKEKPEKKSDTVIPYLILPSRLILFLLFQLMVALVAGSWEKSEKYWLLTATLTNIVSFSLLYVLFKSEGKNIFSIFSFNRATLKKDLLVFLVVVMISIPIGYLPGYFLIRMIWEDPNIPTALMFGHLEKGLVYILLIAFPVTIALAEIATYFVYVMKKLKQSLKWKWMAVLLPVLFLSLQHCALPFIPDWNFILYRALVFLPFAALIGISIHWRPSLFIYFAIFHGLMDFGTALMFLSAP